MLIYEKISNIENQLYQTQKKVQLLSSILNLFPAYLPVAEIYDQLGYKTAQGLLNRLQNGEYEPEKDFKKEGKKWYISFEKFIELRIQFAEKEDFEKMIRIKGMQ